jgi:1,2-diacylglycerol 3-alpha-glucosyltransferase
MKIALVCSGIGREHRGFEAFTQSLFLALDEHVHEHDVTLFKGAGEKKVKELIVPSLGRYGLPTRLMDPKRAYMIETRSFGCALYPVLRYGRFDIVHYNDLLTGSVLFHLRKLFGGQFKLLYCNGAPSPAVQYHHRCDFAQVLTETQLAEALEFGMAAERLFLIPYGVDARVFSPETKTHRDQVRKQLNIPRDAKVVLTVAALKRSHKRLDHVIREVSRLAPDTWLVAAGQRTDETRSLELEAGQQLPGRWRFISWPHEQVRFLYGAADVFALPSLTEGFGLVIVEAMLSGLPVVIHDGPEFRWLASESRVLLVNMANNGELSQALLRLLLDGDKLNSRPEAIRRFSWEGLVPRYIHMYETLAQTNDARHFA